MKLYRSQSSKKSLQLLEAAAGFLLSMSLVACGPRDPNSLEVPDYKRLELDENQEDKKSFDQLGESFGDIMSKVDKKKEDSEKEPEVVLEKTISIPNFFESSRESVAAVENEITCEDETCEKASHCAKHFGFKYLVDPIYEQITKTKSEIDGETLVDDKQRSDDTRPRIVDIKIDANSVSDSKLKLTDTNAYYCIEMEVPVLENFEVIVHSHMGDNISLFVYKTPAPVEDPEDEEEDLGEDEEENMGEGMDDNTTGGNSGRPPIVIIF